MTEAATGSSTAAGTRPARRSPTDLPFAFADRALVDALVAERGEPGWLRDDRLAALAAFEATPVEANLLYTPYVDLRAARLDGAVPYRVTADGTPSTSGIPDDAAGILEIREDGVAALALADDVASQGVRLDTLGGLVRRDEALARRLATREGSLPADDKLAHLSRAAWSQGAVLHVPAGVRVERPFVVRWVAGAPDRALLGRTIVALEDGAEATLVEELVGEGTVPGRQALLGASTEILLGAHSRLAMASLQELGPDQVTFQQRLAHIGEGAELRWALAQLGSRLVRSRVDNVLAGDRSVVEQVEIVFGAAGQLHDLTSYTRHRGRDTTGEILSKGVLLDDARTYLKGMITIEKTAIGTDSYLGEFGMNLSKAARSVAIPSLEIDQPDCRRAAHSSSVGPIDENQLFYLESRGIHPDDARKFIVLGFLEPVVARVPLAEAQDRLRDALEAKWAAGLRSASAA